LPHHGLFSSCGVENSGSQPGVHGPLRSYARYF